MVGLCKTKIWRKCKDRETIFDTSNFELDRLLPKSKNENVIGLMKDELLGQTTEKFFGLRAKSCRYLRDNNDENKKAKNKNVCHKKKT